MKRYHEICWFVNEDKTVAAFGLYDTESQNNVFVNNKEFCDMVRAEEVQNFVWDDNSNTYQIFYNEEELKASGKVAAKWLQKHTKLEDYLKLDASVPAELLNHLIKHQSEIVFGVTITSAKLPFVGVITYMSFMGTRANILRYIGSLSERDRKMVTERDKFGYTFGICQKIVDVQPDYYKNLLKGLIISTETLKKSWSPNAISELKFDVKNTELIERVLKENCTKGCFSSNSKPLNLAFFLIMFSKRTLSLY